jgi:hypothetical protein
MLTVLPGIRELRTPLACGLSWLLVVYLAARRVDPTLSAVVLNWFNSLPPKGVVVPEAAVLTMFTFVAYLVGIVLTISPRGSLGGRLLAACELWAPGNRPEFIELTGRLRSQVQARVAGSSQDLQGEDRDAAERGEQAVGDDDLAPLRTGLMLRMPAVYRDTDRLASEGALRLSIAPPLGIMALWAAPDWPVWVRVAALGLTAALFARGLGKGLEERVIVRQACLDGEVSHPLRKLLAPDR